MTVGDLSRRFAGPVPASSNEQFFGTFSTQSEM
jgi:hypothetical protein